MSGQWWSIEVSDDPMFVGVQTAVWRLTHEEALIEAALTHGATNWNWIELPAGVVLELEFPDWADWTRYRDLPGVRAALDAVPDPINGLYIYPGRGGSAGASQPRHPRRPVGAGAAPLPVSAEPVIVARDVLVEPPAGPV